MRSDPSLYRNDINAPISYYPLHLLLAIDLYAIPAARFFPLMLFHSKPNEVTKDSAPQTTAIINTCLTATLYASNTSCNYCSPFTIPLIPVAPALIIVAGSIFGIRFDISLTRPFDNTELEIARNIAPARVCENITIALPMGKVACGRTA